MNARHLLLVLSAAFTSGAFVVALTAPSNASGRPAPLATRTPPPVAAVLQVREMSVERAAQVLRGLFPSAQIRVDVHANAVVVYAKQEQVDAMRTVVQGLDVKNPHERTNEVVPLRVKTADQLVTQIQPLYPSAHVAPASKNALLVRADPQDLAQIKALIGSLESSSATPTPSPVPVSSLRVLVANPRTVAQAVEHSYPRVRANITGSTIVLSGPSDALDGAEKLAQSLDQPAANVRYTQIYRIKNVDARSLSDLIQRSFPSVKVTLDQELNALSILATPNEHERIAAGIQQLDGGQSSGGGMAQGSAGAAYGDGNIAVVQLESAMPGLNGSPSTSASDIANAVQQSLNSLASDLHIAVPANSNEIILTGSPQSIRLAQRLIAKLDADLPLVVLDTEVLEIDESAARNLGISTPGGVISSVFSEVLPTPNPFTGQPGRMVALQQLTRTPFQFTVAINTLISKGNARVLADPRITTVSGRTATIHAGDQINILTQTGGSIGTPVTQQLQTFNTGVSLDITPLVGPSGKITVSLHPVVNSLTGVSSTGLPQISTRDTQTVVQLQDNQTLVIGGLIQEESQHSVSKVPILGELPLIGKLFDSSNNNYVRNELVIVVTPHILHAGESAPAPNATMGLPTPQPLPTVPPEATFPVVSPTPRTFETSNPMELNTPTPRRTPIPISVGPVLNTPTPTPSPTSALPTPAAFASANVYQFGTPPQNAYAGPLDAPQIFYATLSPTVLKPGAMVAASVITTTNVAKVTIGTTGWSTTLNKLSPSTWQTSFNFPATTFIDQRTINLQLIAARADGTSSQIQIPVSLQNSP